MGAAESFKTALREFKSAILSDRDSRDMMVETVQNQQPELAALIADRTNADGVHATAIARLFLIRASQPTEPLHILHEPALCLVAQGQKQVILADQFYFYGSEQCLVVPIDVPIVGQVTEATLAAPYLCLRLDLDPGELGSLILETGLDVPKHQPLQQGLSLSPVTPPLLDAAIRLMRLLETPQDIAILAPLIVREILYRLLSAEHNPCLRQIAIGDRRLYAINRAINWLKNNYSKPFQIDEIAREACISPSTLHHHFKAVTAMSPLQYQKQLRLQEARRLMLGKGMDAASAGYQVGYESPSQFSREYRRLFGAPPSYDIARLKSSSEA
ncbi:MAG: AraC family transcriptional regulator [Leptolyngbyaceae cyanobacterium CSU_1_3]|nr:AraC family transcriptional regulator [Microcoleus sp. SU_5_3]NJR53049.1 AraC family transcriptional regulator [Leptolyngbyaceae cyanobacterium CSU_1_3]